MSFDGIHLLLALLAGLGFALAWFAHHKANSSGDATMVRLQALETELAELRASKSEAERQLAAKAEAVTHLNIKVEELRAAQAASEAEGRTLQGQLISLRADSSDYQAQVISLTGQLRTKTEELAAMTARYEEARALNEEINLKLTSSEETLRQERRQAEEKIATLTSVRDHMTKEFKVIAEDVMSRHGETFSKQNKEQIDTILSPLREKMVEFQQGLQAAHTESTADRARLAEHIRLLSEHSTRMSSETENLTRALKGQSQTQGAWGEMILASILEKSGLREGEEYVTQESHTTEDGNRLRPDVVVNLPGGQRLVVDSKVSLTAFEEYVNSEDPALRTTALARHVQSLRTHITTLGSKDYHELVGSDLDYVVMFVPIEGALAAALQADPKLTAFAVDNNVTISTPTTLMVALRTVASVWSIERRNVNSEKIAIAAGKLYDKFNGFLGNMEKIAKGLKGAQAAYDDAYGQLATGRGAMVSHFEAIKKLGAKTNKSLHASFADAGAGDESEDDLALTVDD